MIIKPDEGVNPLVSLLNVIGNSGGFFSGSVLFFAVLGLYGAMLSTASTQLIAVSHTLYEDVFSHIRKPTFQQRLESKKELGISRLILILSAVLSTLLVQLLSSAGFSIADLVFAVYGAQLGLCPLVIAALVLKRERLKFLSGWATLAISTGFITGWGSALFGRFSGNTNMVFLAPVFSLIISSTLLGIGLLTEKNSQPKS